MSASWTSLYEQHFQRHFHKPFDVQVYGKLYREALVKAGITDYVRPFHDGRHTSITTGSRPYPDPEAATSRSLGTDISFRLVLARRHGHVALKRQVIARGRRASRHPPRGHASEPAYLPREVFFGP